MLGVAAAVISRAGRDGSDKLTWGGASPAVGTCMPADGERGEEGQWGDARRPCPPDARGSTPSAMARQGMSGEHWCLQLPTPAQHIHMPTIARSATHRAGSRGGCHGPRRALQCRESGLQVCGWRSSWGPGSARIQERPVTACRQRWRKARSPPPLSDVPPHLVVAKGAERALGTSALEEEDAVLQRLLHPKLLDLALPRQGGG